MKDIFENRHAPRDEFDDVDLLYGLPGDSNGEALEFFQTLAREQGIDAQQDYARLASTITYPQFIVNYTAEMALKLHTMMPDRNTGAWELTRKEIGSCIGYLSILSEQFPVPFPKIIDVDSEKTLVWDVRYLGDEHKNAGLLIPELEMYETFCEDPENLGDTLQARLELLGLSNEAK